MGMFDSFYADCPKCNERIEWQSKAGDCCLGSYYPGADIPYEIVKDLDGEMERCPGCGHVLTAEKEVLMTLKIT